MNRKNAFIILLIAGLILLVSYLVCWLIGYCRPYCVPAAYQGHELPAPKQTIIFLECAVILTSFAIFGYIVWDTENSKS